MKNIDDITTSIHLQEQIAQSSLSSDVTVCALGGGGYKNYFYSIDINNNKQY